MITQSLATKFGLIVLGLGLAGSAHATDTQTQERLTQILLQSGPPGAADGHNKPKPTIITPFTAQSYAMDAHATVGAPYPQADAGSEHL
ncbi:MAG: hypothetical protein ABSC06_26390 [Rhodopila sp.]|jgi:hypothetical protein